MFVNQYWPSSGYVRTEVGQMEVGVKNMHDLVKIFGYCA